MDVKGMAVGERLRDSMTYGQNRLIRGTKDEEEVSDAVQCTAHASTSVRYV